MNIVDIIIQFLYHISYFKKEFSRKTPKIICKNISGIIKKRNIIKLLLKHPITILILQKLRNLFSEMNSSTYIIILIIIYNTIYIFKYKQKLKKIEMILLPNKASFWVNYVLKRSNVEFSEYITPPNPIAELFLNELFKIIFSLSLQFSK